MEKVNKFTHSKQRGAFRSADEWLSVQDFATRRNPSKSETTAVGSWSFALFIFLLLDLIKPFQYSLSCEFLFLGITLLSLSETPIWISLAMSMLFGCFRDMLSFGRSHLALIEFPLIVLFNYYFLSYILFTGNKKYAFIIKIGIAAAAIIIHIAVNSFFVNSFLPLYSLRFFFQSIVLYILLNYLFYSRDHKAAGFTIK
jgi:hypothetical protein